MFSPDEARSMLAFLDRCAINGHKERIAMNHLVTKLASVIPPPELDGHPDTASEAPAADQGEGDGETGD
jgi:hypothetical protein